MSLSVIIVAAGSGKRMGFDKLMAPLGGKPVLQHTLDRFASSPEVSEIIIVTTKDRFHSLIKPTHLPVYRVDGGTERHFSVANGLNQVSPNISHIAVHDGARPLISTIQITKVLESAQETKASTSARRITETVKRSTDNNYVASSLSRENLWIMETPQIFESQTLKGAYSKVLEKDLLVTDEVSAVEYLGIQTKLVANTTPNPKITFPEDLTNAEIYL